MFGSDDVDMEKETMAMPKKGNYVSQSAVALRCRVMPPPCMKNPYLKDASDVGVDPFGNQRTKCAGTVQLVLKDIASNYTFFESVFCNDDRFLLDELVSWFSILCRFFSCSV